jgi:hypothetical protein
VADEESPEHARYHAADRGADHPRQRDVEAGVARPCIRPVDDDRTARGEKHVLRVQIEMEQRLALVLDRSQTRS